MCLYNRLASYTEEKDTIVLCRVNKNIAHRNKEIVQNPTKYAAEMPASADSKTTAVKLSYTPNSRAARRNWRRPPHPSCRLDS